MGSSIASKPLASRAGAVGLVLLALLFAPSVAAGATTIDTHAAMHPGSNEYLIEGSYQSLGQTFTVPAGATRLDGFSLWAYQANTGKFAGLTAPLRGYLYAWSGTAPTGPALYRSDPVAGKAGEYHFSPGDIQLEAGARYVLELSSGETGAGAFTTGYSKNDVYGGGELVRPPYTGTAWIEGGYAAGQDMPACIALLAPGESGGGCGSRHATATKVVCSYSFKSLTDDCAITVADSGATPRSTPIGQVKLSATGKGAFTAGASCGLQPVAGSPGVAGCTVHGYRPPAAGSARVSASYLGDSRHSSSGAQTKAATVSSALIARDLNGCAVLPRRAALRAAACPAPVAFNGAHDPLTDPSLTINIPLDGSDVDATVCMRLIHNTGSLDDCAPPDKACADPSAPATLSACAPPSVCMRMIHGTGGLDACGGPTAADAPPGALCMRMIHGTGSLDACGSGASGARRGAASVSAATTKPKPPPARGHLVRAQLAKGLVKLRFHLKAEPLAKIEAGQKRVLMELYTITTLSNGHKIRARSFLTPAIPKHKP